MRRLLVICLCFALYAPQIARICVYAECRTSTVIQEQQNCDCVLKDNGQAQTPLEKQAEIIVKTDWKLLNNADFPQIICAPRNIQQHYAVYQVDISDPFTQTIFRPPVWFCI